MTPQAFKLEHPSSGNTVHAGVLEFTSPLPDNGYLPQWMMDHLGVKDGEEVDFKHVELPKGKFVRLQPVSSAWLVSVCVCGGGVCGWVGGCGEREWGGP